jgi:hypothetical protein
MYFIVVPSRRCAVVLTTAFTMVSNEIAEIDSPALRAVYA